MRTLLILLVSTLIGHAQIHSNKPVPEIMEESVRVIDEDITGWSLSKDGQWISADMKIPVRAVSKDEEAYEGETAELGLDNISKLLLYPALYGNDTLYILVKEMESGYYKYPSTQQRWYSTTSAYYWVFNRQGLKAINDTAGDDIILNIPLLDYGELGEVKTKHLPEALSRHLVIKPKTGRVLSIAVDFDNTQPNKIFFQLSSQHTVFPDVEGVVRDFTQNGRSLYGTPLLIEFLHYEYDKDSFYKFFSPL